MKKKCETKVGVGKVILKPILTSLAQRYNNALCMTVNNC